MAIDMGINKSFIKLLRSGMGKGKTREQLEEERHLVVHSRTWFCVSLLPGQRNPLIAAVLGGASDGVRNGQTGYFARR